MGLIPGLGRSPGGGNGSSLQDFCLENPVGGGAWWAAVYSIAELDLTEKTERAHIQCLLLFEPRRRKAFCIQELCSPAIVVGPYVMYLNLI